MDMVIGEAGWRDEAFKESNKGKMHVRFYDKQEKHNFKSKVEKRPIFHTVTYILKLIPGDQSLRIDRKMREADMEEFPQEWALYQNKAANKVIGTPIDAAPFLSETQKAEYKALNILTIDQLAVLPDSAGFKIMGLEEFRQKAKNFIRAAESGAAEEKLQAELAARDLRLTEQDAEMARLKEQMAALVAAQSEKPAKRKYERKAA